MDADQILAEIRDANLSYLMLAQSLIRADRSQALFRLGISEETADLLKMLSPAQLMKIASSNTLAVPHACRRRPRVEPAGQPRQVHQRWRGSPSRQHPDGGPPPGSRLIPFEPLF